MRHARSGDLAVLAILFNLSIYFLVERTPNITKVTNSPGLDDGDEAVVTEATMVIRPPKLAP